MNSRNFRQPHILAVFTLLASSVMMPARASAASESPQPGAPLTVRISGADPGVGQLAASLFASEETFLSEPVLLRRAPVNEQGLVVLDFGPLAPGAYALAVYWDENDNGELDTGLFRIPKEKVGFSNNARGRMGPAKWEAARFEHGLEPLELQISVSSARD